MKDYYAALRSARHRAGDHSLCSPSNGRHGICSKCGRTIQISWHSASPDKRRCRDCQGKPAGPEDARPCELCGTSYVPGRRASYKPPQRFCSKSCTRAWANGARPPYERKDVGDSATRHLAKSRARHLRHAQTWDGITDAEILDRDGWRCQIPGCKRRPIRKDLKHPHPRSKSIDHIIPLSLGGDDTAVNKRAAHLRCNVVRSANVDHEQMALIGSLREPPLATQVAGERPVIRRNLCYCGNEKPPRTRRCDTCQKQHDAEAEERRAEAGERRILRASRKIEVFTCRYCGELKVAPAARGMPRKACSARPCQLARLAANNLRVRHGLTADEADAQVIAAMTNGKDGWGRWQAS